MMINWTFPKDFEFGIANASAHVEDQLNDPWMQFAASGKSNGFLNHERPEQRLRFWTEPEIEINLAKELGVKVFRLSVDWHRLVPNTPSDGEGVQDHLALEHYKYILRLIQEAGMSVMLSLFHHSLPGWAIEKGGWTQSDLAKNFVNFGLDVFKALDPQVTYWNTFNEPNVYNMFSYVVGNWPPGKANLFGAIKIGPLKGAYFKAFETQVNAHNDFYRQAKRVNPDAKIGIAHNTAFYEKGTVFSQFSVAWSWKNMNFLFPDKVQDHCDFIGFNYYGSEFMTPFGIHFNKKAEYNDAGRAINPQGLYKMLQIFHRRYQKPLFITENGIADEDDILRSAYLVEHLIAVHQALKEGIPIMGYIQWSLSDNFEWSDGYGPKFGLVAVDRKNNLKRTPRDSFYFFQKIAKEHQITEQMRSEAWKKVESAFNTPRKMYRHQNAKNALDEPRIIPYQNIDWRLPL